MISMAQVGVPVRVNVESVDSNRKLASVCGDRWRPTAADLCDKHCDRREDASMGRR